jgi:hypothetical protein
VSYREQARGERPRKDETMTETIETLRARLDVLNEEIYEPEEHMQPSERERRIRERDRVYERLMELENVDD